MKLKNKILLILTTCLFAVIIFSSRAYASDGKTTNINVPGTMDYTKAQEVLKIVNENRKAEGLDELVMDEELMETAMLRAAETAILFDHTRPDGTLCFSASSKMYGENIACGSTTASGVMNVWMNSEGHKSNILRSGFKSIGIGCYKVRIYLLLGSMLWF